jgi:hypothetical protein
LLVLCRSDVKRIESDAIVLDIAGRAERVRNDSVIVRIGGEPSSSFLEVADVRAVTKESPRKEARASAG